MGRLPNSVCLPLLHTNMILTTWGSIISHYRVRFPICIVERQILGHNLVWEAWDDDWAQINTDCHILGCQFATQQANDPTNCCNCLRDALFFACSVTYLIGLSAGTRQKASGMQPGFVEWNVRSDSLQNKIATRSVQRERWRYSTLQIWKGCCTCHIY